MVWARSIFSRQVQLRTALHLQMTYAGTMILAFTVLLGVTLGSVLIIRLLWKANEQSLSQAIQTARRS